jgi:hypothetical protein
MALVALLDLGLSALGPALLSPLDDARTSALAGAASGVDYNELARRVAVCAATNAVAGVAVAYARPQALCPCHALPIGDLLNEATNGVVGGMATMLVLAALANLCWYFIVGQPEPMLPDSDEWPTPQLLPAMCMRDRVSVQLSACLLLVSHTFLPLVVATTSSLRSLRRVVLRLEVRGPLEATVLAGKSTPTHFFLYYTAICTLSYVVCD